jgi:hypothetical protein
MTIGTSSSSRPAARAVERIDGSDLLCSGFMPDHHN